MSKIIKNIIVLYLQVHAEKYEKSQNYSAFNYL